MQQQHHTNTQPQTQNHANQLSRRRHSIIRHPPDKTNPRGPRRRRRRRRQTRQLFIVLVTFFVSFLWFGIGSVFSVLFFFLLFVTLHFCLLWTSFFFVRSVVCCDDYSFHTQYKRAVFSASATALMIPVVNPMMRGMPSCRKGE